MGENAKDERTKLGEIFSQCWESEEFKKNFIENPKEVMKEYGVTYDDTLDYKILESPERTVTYVLPYEHVKEGMELITTGLNNSVKDVDGPKQLIPENWKVQIIQNTEDTAYIVIPMSPENLTPEELELVNGGFLGFFVAVVIWLVEAVAVATSFLAVAEVSVAVVLVLDVAVAAHVAAIGVTVTATN